MEQTAGALKPHIPNSKAHLTGHEIDYLRESVDSLQWGGDGPFSKKCATFFEDIMGAPCYLTPSGTHALELAAMSLGLEPGDEVILPSFTFVSTAGALVRAGLRPVFIDIRPETLNINESLIEAALTYRTRAIMVVHYAGVAAEMDSILMIAKKHDLLVLEDAAQGVHAFYKSKPLGSLGDLGILSFHQAKNFTCGEGGAVVVKNQRFQRALEIHRQKGTNRSVFLSGEVDRYTWLDQGSNYLLGDLSAAFLYAQLQAMEDITARRRRLYEYYRESLGALAPSRFRFQEIPTQCRPNYHIFPILLEEPSRRDQLITFLKENGVEAITHFVPLHRSNAGQRFGRVGSTMGVTDSIADSLLRLPFYTGLSRDEQNIVIENLKRFFSS